MAIQFVTGFESGAVPEFLSFTNAPTVTAGTDQFASGAYSLKVVSGASAWVMDGIGWTAAAAADEVIVGFAHRTTALSAATVTLLSIQFASGVYLLLRGTTNGSIEVKRSNTQGGSLGTVLSTSSPLIALNAWQYFVVRVVPSTTVGVVEVWINGVREVNLTSANTLQNTASTTRAVSFGRCGANATSQWIDDILVADNTGSGIVAVFDPIQIEGLNPTADVAAGMTGSDGNSTDNWALVDERPAAMADYVESAVSTTRDRYTLSNRSLHTGAVRAVVAVAVASNPDGGTASLKLGARSGASEDLSAAKALGADPLHVYHIAEVDPASGIAFTSTDVNGLEAIVEVA